jgi:hypothetical protein
VEFLPESGERGACDVFGAARTTATTATVDVKSLPAKIGKLTLENLFFRGCAHQGGIAERKAMIDREHDLSGPTCATSGPRTGRFRARTVRSRRNRSKKMLIRMYLL